MKALPQQHGQQDWDSRLLRDLSFIKKHRRYPFRRMTLMPLLYSTLLVAFFVRLIWVFLIVKDLKSGSSVIVLTFVLLAVPMAVAVRRYVDLIRFSEVKTPFFLAENMKLLEEFLQDQRLLTFRHPEAPEVFQIISKNISAVGEEREVLIFICDDKRVLVNSHFTTSRNRFRLFTAPTHHRQMIRQFRSWLNARDTKSTAVTLN